VLDHLKSVLFIFSMFFFSLFMIGYVQNYFLSRPVALFVNAVGFGPKSVGEFFAGWLIIALPNVLCGVIIGRHVPFSRQLYISPLMIVLFFSFARICTTGRNRSFGSVIRGIFCS